MHRFLQNALFFCARLSVFLHRQLHAGCAKFDHLRQRSAHRFPFCRNRLFLSETISFCHKQTPFVEFAILSDFVDFPKAHKRKKAKSAPRKNAFFHVMLFLKNIKKHPKSDDVPSGHHASDRNPLQDLWNAFCA